MYYKKRNYLIILNGEMYNLKMILIEYENGEGDRVLLVIIV